MTGRGATLTFPRPSLATCLEVSQLAFRLERVKHLLKSEISEIVRDCLKDPRIGFVTVTDVEVTKDLGHARVFVSVYGNKEMQNRTLEGLESATNFIRTELGHRVELRFIPQLTFRFDPSIERADRISRLLNELPPQESHD